MTMIKHDDQGFLLGNKANELDTIDLLQAIKDEIAGLRRELPSVAMPVRGGPPVVVTVKTDAPVAMPSATGESTPAAATLTPRGTDLSAALYAPATAERQDSGVSTSNTTTNITNNSTVANAGSTTSSNVTNLDNSRKSSSTRSEKVATPLSDGAKKGGERDAKGRFVATPSSAQSDSESGAAPTQAITLAVSDVGNKITGAVGELAFSEESDPSVKAFNEVAKPLQRGLGKIFGGSEDKGDERWYKRFWRHMREDKKLDKKRHKEQIDILEDIEKKEGGKKGAGGLIGMVMLVTKALLLLAKSILSLKILDAFRKLPYIGGGGSAGGKKGKGKPGSSKPSSSPPGKTVGNVGKVLKRVPILGALLTAGGSALDVRASESNKNATRKEKDVTTGSAVGRGVGTLSGAMAGGAAGAAAGSVVPIVGTAIGGFVGAAVGAWMGESAGEVIGSKFGEWVGELRSSQFIKTMTSTWDDMTTFTGHLWGQASKEVGERFGKVSDLLSASWATVTDSLKKVSDKIGSSWDAAVEGMAEKWGKVTSKLESFWATISDSASKANDWIKEKTGIDIGGGIASASEAVSTAVGEATDAVSSAASNAWDFAKGAVSKATSAVGGAVSAVGDATGVTGAVNAVRRSAEYTANRSANKSALEEQMVSAGITDPVEQASFMAQMDHESAGFTRMEENLNYSPEQFLKVFGSRAGITTEQEAAAILSQGKEKQAEVMYGGEWGAKNLGNTEKGDGFAFRGRGHTQLTGRSNYQQAGDALGIDLVNNPDMAAEPETAAKIATWYWQSRSGLSEAGKAGDVEATTRKINGGLNGLEDRKAKTAMYMQEYQTRSVPQVVSAPQPEPKGVAVAGAAMPALEVAVAGVAPVSATASAVARAPSMTRVPSVPMVSESPVVQAPLSTGGSSSRDKQQAHTTSKEVSRDVSDRRIAHVVTGAHSQL